MTDGNPFETSIRASASACRPGPQPRVLAQHLGDRPVRRHASSAEPPPLDVRGGQPVQVDRRERTRLEPDPAQLAVDLEATEARDGPELAVRGGVVGARAQEQEGPNGVRLGARDVRRRVSGRPAIGAPGPLAVSAAMP